MSISELYPAHLRTQLVRAREAMAATDVETLVIASGAERMQYLDDMAYPFKPNPHFKLFVPLLKHPHCTIVIGLGDKPTLIYHQPEDYWHEVPTAPTGEWVEHFDVKVVRDAASARALLPTLNVQVVLLAESAPFADYAPNASAQLLARLHYPRAQKTAYELACMREASTFATRAHRAAERTFRAGGSEFDIHLAYLAAAEHSEAELPYSNIIGLNEHAAVLHYHGLDRHKPLQHLSFLIDAGAQYRGYAADITRTYATHPGVYADMISAVDAAQLRLCAMVVPGTDYRNIHLAAHLEMARIVHGAGLVRMSPESMVETGVSSVFFPHGIGHLIGLQVHDVAGFAGGPDGGTLDKPAGHPYLRLTRRLEENTAVTIEPGIYFIDMLLRTLHDGPHAGDINWTDIDALRHYGGIRIEDDVVAMASGPENLSRDAFARTA